MATQTKITSTGVLRHYHKAEGRTRTIWHRAKTFHRDDPNAHNDDREASWSDPGWEWDTLRRYESDELDKWLANAKAIHDAVRFGRIPPSDMSNPLDMSKGGEDAPAPNYEPKVSNTYEPLDNDEPADTSELAQRVEQAEQLAIVAHEAATAADAKAIKALTTASAATEAVGMLADAVEPLPSRIDALERAQATRSIIEIRTPTAEPIISPIQLRHRSFGRMLKLALSLKNGDRNIWTTGPAGSGKTKAVEDITPLLSQTVSTPDAPVNLVFNAVGALQTPHEVVGYMNAAGNYVRTPFREVYEHGGVFLFDEIDGCDPRALVALNAALSSGWATFPDGRIMRHQHCWIFANANTWGFGGDANYVGRAKQDAASMDRFTTLHWDYDEDLERAIAGTSPEASEWVTTVQKVRAQVKALGAKVVISPRASIKGGQLLDAGVERDLVVEAIFGRYRDMPQWASFGKAAEDFAAATPSNTAEAAIPSPVTPPIANGSLKRVNMSNVKVFSR